MTGWAARLDALPRLALVPEPTPLHAAPKLSVAPHGPRLWFKRDDLIPVAFGGNKVRALDLVVADALQKGADTLVTGAGVLSNHVRATAAVASLARLACIGVYWGARPPRAEGNHRLAAMLGAQLRFTGDLDRASVDAGLAQAATEILARGGRPYLIPRGGACPLAALAHALAVRETMAQCAAIGVSPTCVVMPVGGAATLAGWLLGAALFSAPWRIEAFTVSRPASEATARARRLAAAGAEMIDSDVDIDAVAFRVHDGFVGAGYGVPSREGMEAIETTARAQSIFLDPVYTGKAMAGYRAMRARGAYEGVEDVLFLHTGGAPALFTTGAGAS
jgi:1-aminocyclopropane-1-carboxylate deaminase/D-cysteine desulfhydrase-like pyridoxal-dependent ACC family enzyme